MKISSRKGLTDDEFKMIAGSDLASQMVQNCIGLEDTFHVGSGIIYEWLEDNCSGLYYTTTKGNYYEDMKIYFENENDIALFRLKFEEGND